MDEISLNRFETAEGAASDAYVKALEAFDGIAGIQELKAIARTAERGGIAPGAAALDVGCGFGLETLRIAQAVGSSGIVCGVDTEAPYIEEARARAKGAGFSVDYRVGDARALPWDDATFDAVRAERVLIYLEHPEEAVDEMRRVAKPGGRLAFIEPDFSTTTVNVSDRDLARRALAHEVDTAVRQSWLPGPLRGMLEDRGLTDIRMDTRVAVLPQGLASGYFLGVGAHAMQAGAIDADEGERWCKNVQDLSDAGRLFGSVGYFLFTAQV